MSVQWDDPVTGSSKILAWGVKKRDTKSESFPTAVTITPPGSILIWSKIERSILRVSISVCD